MRKSPKSEKGAYMPNQDKRIDSATWMAERAGLGTEVPREQFEAQRLGETDHPGVAILRLRTAAKVTELTNRRDAVLRSRRRCRAATGNSRISDGT